MKKLYTHCLAVAWCVTILLLQATTIVAQTHTPRTVDIDANCGGFYEYLPEGYESGNQQYPLLVYLHGRGDLGNGSAADLNFLVTNEMAIPKYIAQGLFPKSFTVNGQVYRFIIISPQFKEWPSAWDVQQVVEYAQAHYRVNAGRIYVTGMSMGGGAAWDYVGSNSVNANKVAAVLPVCGASTPSIASTEIIANAGLPVWATHNNGDPTVPVSSTNDYVDFINNSVVPPNPLAKKTIFISNEHDAWTTTYDPNWREGGLNVYEWLLQYQRDVAPLPVTLLDYTATASGQQVTVSWRTAAEQNNQYFTVEYATDGVNFHPLQKIVAANAVTGSSYSYVHATPVYGNNYYRLTQTDLDGTTVKYDIKKIVLETAGKTGLTVYPNPASQYIVLRLSVSAADKLAIEIADISGKVIWVIQYTGTTGYQQLQIPVSALAPGMYMIHVKGEQFEAVQKFIKQ